MALTAHIIACRCVGAVSIFFCSVHSWIGAIAFFCYMNSYLEHIMLCVAIFPKLSPLRSEHSRSLGVPMNLIPLQDFSSLNNISLDVVLYMFTLYLCLGLLTQIATGYFLPFIWPSMFLQDFCEKNKNRQFFNCATSGDIFLGIY